MSETTLHPKRKVFVQVRDYRKAGGDPFVTLGIAAVNPNHTDTLTIFVKDNYGHLADELHKAAIALEMIAAEEAAKGRVR